MAKEDKLKIEVVLKSGFVIRKNSTRGVYEIFLDDLAKVIKEELVGGSRTYDDVGNSLGMVDMTEIAMIYIVGEDKAEVKIKALWCECGHHEGAHIQSSGQTGVCFNCTCTEFKERAD